jgi:(p)ppGpp synthase/HD superfamily hydrolase
MTPYDARWHELIKTGGNPFGLTRAREFAVQAHGDQKYGDAQVPYIEHLDEVVAILEEFEVYNIATRVAGMLHDILEDTSVTYEELFNYYGAQVARVVRAVTNPKGLANRAERHAVTYPQIKRYPQAIEVKLADRIAHMRRGGSKVGMYVKEYPGFREALYTDDTRIKPMWDHLDDLTQKAQASI